MTPAQVIRDLYSAFKDKDEAALRSLLSPNVEWNQCAGFPGGASRRGPDDVIRGILAGNHGLWRGFRADIKETITADGTVVVLGTYAGEHIGTGRAMQADFVHTYRVKDGRVERFDQVTDTAPMVEAMRD